MLDPRLDPHRPREALVSESKIDPDPLDQSLT